MSQSPRGNQLQKCTFIEKAGVVQYPQNAAKIDPNTFFFMKNTLLAMTNSLFMASCQNPNISESPRWNQFIKWTFWEETGMVQNTQNAVKIANAFPFLKNILSVRTNSLFTASYENPNMSQILSGNQVKYQPFQKETWMVQNPQNDLCAGFLMTNTLSTWNYGLFKDSYQNPNMTQIQRGNQLMTYTFQEETGTVQTPQNTLKIDPNAFFL